MSKVMLAQVYPSGITPEQLVKHLGEGVGNASSVLPHKTGPQAVESQDGMLRSVVLQENPLMDIAREWIERPGCFVRTQHANPLGFHFVQHARHLHFLEHSEHNHRVLLWRGSARLGRLCLPERDMKAHNFGGRAHRLVLLREDETGDLDLFQRALRHLSPSDPSHLADVPRTSPHWDKCDLLVLDALTSISVWRGDGMGLLGGWHPQEGFAFKPISGKVCS